MILARNNIRGITSVVQNVLAKNRGYVSTTNSASYKIEFKSALKIKWVKPPKIRSYKAEKSGDGGLDIEPKPQEYANFYEQSTELNDADDIVKKMFSLEYLPQKETQNKKREKIRALVKRHEADRGSMESTIAVMTSEILNLQKYMEQHPRNMRTAHFLKELIDKRKKYLGYLRSWDYKKFEWVLEKLNLVYKPHPPLYTRIERKASMRKLTKMHCQELVAEKLAKYRQQLSIELKAFYLNKVEKLEFIRNEEIACGKEPTVTEEDIIAAKKIAMEYKSDDTCNVTEEDNSLADEIAKEINNLDARIMAAEEIGPPRNTK